MLFGRLQSLIANSDRPVRDAVISRRAVLQVGLGAGGALLIGLNLPGAGGGAEAADAVRFSPNAFIRIERDGQIALTMP